MMREKVEERLHIILLPPASWSEWSVILAKVYVARVSNFGLLTITISNRWADSSKYVWKDSRIHLKTKNERKEEGKRPTFLINDPKVCESLWRGLTMKQKRQRLVEKKVWETLALSFELLFLFISSHRPPSLVLWTENERWQLEATGYYWVSLSLSLSAWVSQRL